MCVLVEEDVKVFDEVSSSVGAAVTLVPWTRPADQLLSPVTVP